MTKPPIIQEYNLINVINLLYLSTSINSYELIVLITCGWLNNTLMLIACVHGLVLCFQWFGGFQMLFSRFKHAAVSIRKQLCAPAKRSRRSWLQWLAWAILGSIALPMTAASANGQLITDPNVCKIVAGAYPLTPTGQGYGTQNYDTYGTSGYAGAVLEGGETMFVSSTVPVDPLTSIPDPLPAPDANLDYCLYSFTTTPAGDPQGFRSDFAVVLDVIAPTVTSITRQTPSTSPTDADSLTWRVTFSEDVANVDAADFSVSGTTATVSNVSTITANSVYDVTVSGGDLATLNGTVTLSFASGQNIADTSANTLSNTLPSATNDNTFVVNNGTPAPPPAPTPSCSTGVDDTFKTTPGTPTTGNVLANDSLVGAGNTTSLTRPTSLFGGAVWDNGDNTFRYTPAPGFTGKDYFTYWIHNADCASLGLVKVTVE